MEMLPPAGAPSLPANLWFVVTYHLWETVITEPTSVLLIPRDCATVPQFNYTSVVYITHLSISTTKKWRMKSFHTM